MEAKHSKSCRQRQTEPRHQPLISVWSGVQAAPPAPAGCASHNLLYFFLISRMGCCISNAHQMQLRLWHRHPNLALLHTKHCIGQRCRRRQDHLQLLRRLPGLQGRRCSAPQAGVEGLNQRSQLGTGARNRPEQVVQALNCEPLRRCHQRKQGCLEQRQPRLRSAKCLKRSRRRHSIQSECFGQCSEVPSSRRQQGTTVF